MKTLTEYLRAWARSQPDQMLYTFLDIAGDPTDSCTYGSFDTRTNGLACVLAGELGVVPGEPVLLVYPPGLEMIAAFFACVKAGALPVPVPPPSAFGQAEAYNRILLVATDSGATLALTDQTVIGTFAKFSTTSSVSAGPSRTGQQANVRWFATNKLDGGSEHFEDRSRGPLFLQYTSGSTQTPRGVLVSHENVIRNCLATVDHAPICISWIPHFHDMGLIGYYLFPLIKGGSAYHFSPADFLRRPLLWLEAISRYGGTCTSAPNFAFDYCLHTDKVPDPALAKLNLLSLRTMMNGSEPVRTDTMQRFLARFARCGLSEKALMASYGLAEHTLCVSSGGRVHVRVNRRLLEHSTARVVAGGKERKTIPIASCGKPLENVDIRIVDPVNRETKIAGELGEIWLSSASKALGYWKKNDLSREIFHAHLAGDISETEFLRTGDMGFLHDGELYVCGRLKDMIIIRGVNVYPTDVEMITERALPPSYRGRVVVFGSGTGTSDEGVVILVATRARDPILDLQALHQEIRKSVTVPVLALAAVQPGSIVRTSSGKISRYSCRDLWRRGAIKFTQCFTPPVHELDESGFSSYLENLIRQGGDDDTLTLEQLGLDSVEFVTLSLEIEKFVRDNGIGGAWVSDEAFDLRTLQSLTVGELRRLGEEIRSGRASMRSVASFYRKTAQAVAKRDALQMRRDAKLAVETRPRHHSKSPAELGSGQILLTGATGFLGSHLLAALVRLTEDKIVVVARGQDDDHACQRVAAALTRTTASQELCSAALPSRIEVLRGDIAKPRLGLSERRWSRLAAESSAVFHCGAEVDYVKTYAELWEPNVFGTREILRLAVEGIPKLVHHISSTFIYGWSTLPRLMEGDDNPHMKELNFGYAQSKWVAEQIVQQAITQGVDARIYRPSLVTASQQGHYVREDITARALSYMIRHRLSVNAKNQISFLPADIAANNIVALALLPDPGARVFHLTADRYYTFEMACQSVSERYGYSFKYVDIDAFVDHMNRFCGEEDILFPLLAFFRRNSGKLDRMRYKRYDNTDYRKARTKSGLFLAEPDLADTMSPIVKFLQREHLIPLPGKGDLTLLDDLAAMA